MALKVKLLYSLIGAPITLLGWLLYVSGAHQSYSFRISHDFSPGVADPNPLCGIWKATNDVVELLDDRGIVPSSVAGVYGDDDEQRHGREFEPMADDPLGNLCKSSRVQQSWYSVAQGDLRQRLGG
jgi:hypothetical protein